MGPILVFDKSFLHSLSVDEAVWLDAFFVSNITPLFFIETLADLEKETRSGRSTEEVVGNLADKTPEMSSKPNVHHNTLIASELTGFAAVPMDGRVLLHEGQALELDGRTEMRMELAPEEVALRRWHQREFLELERSLAKKWRQDLANLDLERQYNFFRRYFIQDDRPKTLEDVKRLCDSILDAPDQEPIFMLGLSLLNVSGPAQAKVLERWRENGRPRLRIFAPYFTHILSIDLFFYLGIAADLIGRQRPSNKVDIAYLYYLPFCMVFVSNDRLHSRIAPFFLTSEQTFVNGSDLKHDLGKLDDHFAALPEETKARGVMSFASRPPFDDGFLVSRLWDKHMSSRWRTDPEIDPQSQGAVKLREMLERFDRESKPLDPKVSLVSDKADQLRIHRVVRAHRGKWQMLPASLSAPRNEEEG